MLIRRYAAHVVSTDQFRDKPGHERLKIAIYGLVSEIGSVVSAVKKEMLHEGGALDSNIAKAELKEELGDVIWYCFAVAQIVDPTGATDVLATDIANLKVELETHCPRTHQIHKVLPQKDLASFLDGAARFPAIRDRTFQHYQDLAFLTARTQDAELLNVCLCVLTQLGAQLMRHLLPDIERTLNEQLRDREPLVILGEIAWHLSAVARLYEIGLDEVVTLNVEKAQARRPSGRPTSLHDKDHPATEQLPRQLEIVFRSPDPRRSTMHWNSEQIGDELTDNAHEPDGYRFHDAMHLANMAHLGWSPVMRKLLKRKRKSTPEIDEVQDGARAGIVEEAILKLVHSEGALRAEIAQPHTPADLRRIFPEDEPIPFRLLKQVRDLSRGLEAYNNKFWEWENAIRDGYRLFYALRHHEGGRVLVDLEKRTTTFTAIND